MIDRGRAALLVRQLYQDHITSADKARFAIPTTNPRVGKRASVFESTSLQGPSNTMSFSNKRYIKVKQTSNPSSPVRIVTALQVI